MSPSIYPSTNTICRSASRNKRSPFDRSSDCFFWAGYFDKIENIFSLSLSLSIYLYISIYAADREPLVFDSGVLGD